MVKLVRSMVPKFGMFPEAAKFAKQIAEYVKDKYKIDIQVCADSKGTIYWIVDYADYGEFGRVRTQISSDNKYWTILKKAKELFVEGTQQDTIMSPF